MKNIYLIFILFTLVTCSSQEEDIALNNAGQIFGATKSKIQFGSSYSTDKGSNKTITISFSNLKLVDESYSKKKITSTIAKNYIDNVKPDRYKGYDFLSVNIENVGEKYEQTYKITDILETKESFKTLDNYFKVVKEKDFGEIKNYVDSYIVNEVPMFVDIYTLNDSIAKGVKDIVITGFKFDKIKETKEPVMVVWAELVYNIDNIILYHTFVMSPKTNKILTIDAKSE